MFDGRSLTAIAVPSVRVEAARELCRAHDMCRRDLVNARHRVSKMLLRHGRVYPKPSSTCSRVHRQWLAGQQFADPVSELAYVDLLAAVDGLTARKQALAERIFRLATEPGEYPLSLGKRRQCRRVLGRSGSLLVCPLVGLNQYFWFALAVVGKAVPRRISSSGEPVQHGGVGGVWPFVIANSGGQFRVRGELSDPGLHRSRDWLPVLSGRAECERLSLRC